MASLPPLTPYNSSKGAFASSFVQTLTQHLNALLQQNQARTQQDQQERQKTFAALVQFGTQNEDPELVKLGLAGLLDEKAGKTDWLGRLKKSPIYEQANQYMSSFMKGGQPAAAKAPSAAMAEPTIPKGTAAAAADQGAGIPFETGPQAPAPPSLPVQAGVTMPSMSEPQASGMSMPPAPGAATQPEPAPGSEYDTVIAALSDPSLKLIPRAQKVLNMFRVGKATGVPFAEFREQVIAETLPNATRQEGARERAILAGEYGLAGRRITAEGKGRNQRVQVVWDQPRAGGKRLAYYRDPETGGLVPMTKPDGQQVADSPEFRQSLSRDAQGNEYTNWVIPGGGGGAAPAAAGATTPTAPEISAPPAPGTRLSPTLPKEQALADDLNKEIAPYHKQGDSVGKILALRGDESGAAQMATIFSFIQNLDQSVVRPSEVTTLQEAQSLVDRWQTSIKRGLGGSDIVVSPGLIDRLRSIATNQYSSTAERQAGVYTRYLEKAEKEKLDASFIVGSIHPSMQAALQQRAQSGQLSAIELRLLELMKKLQIR